MLCTRPEAQNTPHVFFFCTGTRINKKAMSRPIKRSKSVAVDYFVQYKGGSIPRDPVFNYAGVGLTRSHLLTEFDAIVNNRVLLPTDPVDATRIMSGTVLQSNLTNVNRLYYSQDGGRNWNQVSPTTHPALVSPGKLLFSVTDQKMVTCLPNGQVYIQCAKGVVRSQRDTSTESTVSLTPDPANDPDRNFRVEGDADDETIQDTLDGITKATLDVKTTNTPTGLALVYTKEGKCA